MLAKSNIRLRFDLKWNSQTHPGAPLVQGSIVLCVPSRPHCHKYRIDAALSVYNCIPLKADRSYFLHLCDFNRLVCDITRLCSARGCVLLQRYRHVLQYCQGQLSSFVYYPRHRLWACLGEGWWAFLRRDPHCLFV